MSAGGYEQVVFCHDAASGLRSIIVIHDTRLGPALGGVRMWPYPDDDAALTDCLRLARGMTYKAAGAGVSLGGGKSVIIGDPRTDKSEALLRAHGRFIETLGGRYIPGIDVGTEMADLEVIGREAHRVSCVAGDPSPMTALGVLSGMRACAREIFGTGSLEGLRVAIQGAGHVGAQLARQLADEGAAVAVADIQPELAQSVADEVDAELVDSAEIARLPCDVFAPCALGGVLDAATIPRLDCRIVAGSANNVLAAAEHARLLDEAGVLYAPDYVVNAGGLIFLEEEMLGRDSQQAERRVRGVEQLVERVIARAKADRVPTAQAADRVAEERLAALARLGPPFVPARR